jgi:hypothetical protein
MTTSACSTRPWSARCRPPAHQPARRTVRERAAPAQDGWCVHFDKMTKMCRIYESRPYFCRTDAEVRAHHSAAPPPAPLCGRDTARLQPARAPRVRSRGGARRARRSFPRCTGSRRRSSSSRPSSRAWTPSRTCTASAAQRPGATHAPSSARGATRTTLSSRETSKNRAFGDGPSPPHLREGQSGGGVVTVSQPAERLVRVAM